MLRTLGNGARLAGYSDCSKLGGLERYENELNDVKHLLLIGCGSSYNAAMSTLHLFKSLKMYESV
jgi:glutamine---fructose-6-phosphate transaminase (isomerizing)